MLQMVFHSGRLVFYWTIPGWIDGPEQKIWEPSYSYRIPWMLTLFSTHFKGNISYRAQISNPSPCFIYNPMASDFFSIRSLAEPSRWNSCWRHCSTNIADVFSPLGGHSLRLFVSEWGNYLALYVCSAACDCCLSISCPAEAPLWSHSGHLGPFADSNVLQNEFPANLFSSPRCQGHPCKYKTICSRQMALIAQLVAQLFFRQFTTFLWSVGNNRVL